MAMEHPHILSFTEIKQAAERIEGGIIHTPLCVGTYTCSAYLHSLHGHWLSDAQMISEILLILVI